MIGDRIRVHKEGVPFGTCEEQCSSIIAPPSTPMSDKTRSRGDGNYCHEGRSRGIGESRLALRLEANRRVGGRTIGSNDYFRWSHQYEDHNIHKAPASSDQRSGPKTNNQFQLSTQGTDCQLVKLSEKDGKTHSGKSLVHSYYFSNHTKVRRNDSECVAVAEVNFFRWLVNF